jgi:hypothetical protein
MKQKIMAILMLVAVSCQKERIPKTQVVKEGAQNELSAGAKQLLNDSNFVKLYKISLPIFKTVTGKSKLRELTNDTLLYYKECSTLAPKLGFKDSAALVNYYQQVYTFAPKVAKAHPYTTLQQYQEAVKQLDQTNLYADPCDAVIGQFASDVAACASLGVIPVIGEVLAGTCMVGALITYNAGMEQCSASGGK